MPISIKSHHHILPTIDPGLFSWLFDQKFSPRYYAWRDGKATYQLRVIGGPGSGKTTVVSLLAQDVSVASHQDANRKCAVVSIFLDIPPHTADSKLIGHNEEPAKTFLSRFRNEILSQLCRQSSPTAPGSSNGTSSGSEDFGEKQQQTDRIQCERETVLAASTGFETITLLVDGIDILWPRQETYLALEDELAAFNNCGWRVMASSRVLWPFRVTQAACDVCMDVEGSQPIGDRGIWWECDLCLAEQYYICSVCKAAGHGCKNPDHSTHHLAIQPSRSAQPQPNVLEISIHNHPALCLRNLITRHLQEEHGNLNLPHPSPQTLPPLSPLGHSLTTSHRVPELLNHLVTKSAGNPFLCLARLEHIRDAKSAEEALATADRLPSNIVNVLRAGVDRIISSLPAELLNLAMDALIEVANSGTADGMEWEELVEVLEERGHEDVSEERILFATGGFLKCYPMGGSVSIKCFCDDFALFVEQNYHEGLSRRARSLEQQGEEEEEERG